MNEAKIQALTQVTGSHFRWDVECGVHSGLPDCCILYYCTTWEKATSQEIETYHEKLLRLRKHPGYVPCPDCFKKRHFVAIQPCKCWHKRYLQLRSLNQILRIRSLDQEDVAFLSQYPPAALKVGSNPVLVNQEVIRYLQKHGPI
jgi:hypothetical protein